MSRGDVPASVAAVHRARTALRRAAMDLGIWHRRTDTARRTYVEAGDGALARLDEAIRGLYEARDALVSELRRDEDERAARTDALLARPIPESTTAPAGTGATTTNDGRTSS